MDHIKQAVSGEVVCEEVITKLPGYKSYKVGINLNEVANVVKPDIWPEGVLVSEN